MGRSLPYLLKFILTFCAHRTKNQTALMKGQGSFFWNQLYSNTDLINAYLHIHSSPKSVLNNIWPLLKPARLCWQWETTGFSLIQQRLGVAQVMTAPTGRRLLKLTETEENFQNQKGRESNKINQHTRFKKHPPQQWRGGVLYHSSPLFICLSN